MTTLFLTGDVMTGRGIDQVLPSPSEPTLHESYVRNANTYVELAEEANGPISRPVSFDYIWGAALAVLERAAPDARIVNLETSVTRSEEYWRGKGINYRMHPANVPCLNAAGIDCCVLANNHVLDFGYSGLAETLATLRAAGLQTAGAGLSSEEAAAPAIIDLPDERRVLVFAFGSEASGIPFAWRARRHRPGINVLSTLSRSAAREAARTVEPVKRAGDLVVVSVHWGGNWGYAIPSDQREFAHGLIDSGLVDVVHGHSSHHAKGIEVYGGKPIIYGCGDFLNDYEGISGHEHYRGDLSLMYFVTMNPADGLESLRITPLQTRRFSLHATSRADVEWLRTMLDREGIVLGTRAELTEDDGLTLRWASSASAAGSG